MPGSSNELVPRGISEKMEDAREGVVIGEKAALPWTLDTPRASVRICTVNTPKLFGRPGEAVAGPSSELAGRPGYEAER